MMKIRKVNGKICGMLTAFLLALTTAFSALLLQDGEKAFAADYSLNPYDYVNVETDGNAQKATLDEKGLSFYTGLYAQEPVQNTATLTQPFDVSNGGKVSLRFQVPIYTYENKEGTRTRKRINENGVEETYEEKYTYCDYLWEDYDGNANTGDNGIEAMLCKNLITLTVYDWENPEIAAYLRIWGDSDHANNANNTDISISIATSKEAIGDKNNTASAEDLWIHGTCRETLWENGVCKVDPSFYLEFDKQNIFSSYWGNNTSQVVGVLEKGAYYEKPNANTVLATLKEKFQNTKTVGIEFELSSTCWTSNEEQCNFSNGDVNNCIYHAAKNKGKVVIKEINGQSYQVENGVLTDTDKPFVSKTEVKTADLTYDATQNYTLQVKSNEPNDEVEATEDFYCDYAADSLKGDLTYTVKVTGESGYSNLFVGEKGVSVVENVRLYESGENTVQVIAKDAAGNEFVGEPTTVNVEGSEVEKTFLTLNDNVVFKYRAKLLDGFSNPTVDFAYDTQNGTKEEKDVSPIEDDGTYVFAYSGIRLQKLTAPLKAVVWATEDLTGKRVVVASKVKTVQSYLEELLSKTAGDLGLTEEQYTKLQTLAVDILNCGAAAQEYRDFDVENLANANLTEEQKAKATEYVEPTKTYRNINSTDDIIFMGARLWLDYKVGLCVAFRLTENVSIENLTMTAQVEGKAPVSFTYVLGGQEVVLLNEANKQYQINFGGIMATEFDKKVTFTLSAEVNGEESVATLEYSVATCIASRASQAGADLAIVKAIYCYGLSAKAYESVMVAQ